MLRIPKSGKRAAIDAGLRSSDPATDVVIVLDSDTIWAPGALREMLLRSPATSLSRPGLMGPAVVT